MPPLTTPAAGSVEKKTTGYVIWANRDRTHWDGPVHVFGDGSMGHWPDTPPTVYPTLDAAVAQIERNARDHWRDYQAFTIRKVVETERTVTETTFEAI